MKPPTISSPFGRIARIAAACSIASLAVASLPPLALAGIPTVRNGDVNGDGGIDISDPIAILVWLFLGTAEPVPAACAEGVPDLENGDANGDGLVDLSDAVHLLAWLFNAGPAPVESRCLAPATCLERLDALGIAWTAGPEAPGVATPVTVTMPLGGMPFRNSSGNIRQTWFMDCELAVAIHRMVEILKDRGVVEIVDLGIYNYRCIGGGTPPDCPNGISLHASALAVDIATLVVAGEEPYSMADDWVIDVDGFTCSPRERAARDVFLHDALCDIYDAGIFMIHLSPNYNADHRNHWHLDLTAAEGRFIR